MQQMPKEYRVARVFQDPAILLKNQFTLRIPEDINLSLEAICRNLRQTKFFFSQKCQLKFDLGYLETLSTESKTGEIIIEYRPFSIQFGIDRAYAKDLFTGETHAGKRNPHPELSRSMSIISNVMDKNIASMISAIAQNNWQLDRIPDGKRTIIRDISYDVGDGEIWYVPIFEIPIREQKCLKLKATYSLNPIGIGQTEGYESDGYIRKFFPVEKIIDFHLEFLIPFYLSGAVFRDGFFGNPLPTNSDFVSEMFFNPNEIIDSKFTLIVKSKKSAIRVNESKLSQHFPWTDVSFRYSVFGIGKKNALSKATYYKWDHNSKILEKYLPEESMFALDLNEIGSECIVAPIKGSCFPKILNDESLQIGDWSYERYYDKKWRH